MFFLTSYLALFCDERFTLCSNQAAEELTKINFNQKYASISKFYINGNIFD